MSEKIIIREVLIDEVVKVNGSIVEFDGNYKEDYFEERYKNKNKLIIVAYIDDQPAGYIVGYDEFEDGSFYCWMAGVDPKFRKMGLLKALMDFQEKWAKEKNYNKIKIKTRNNRREMLAYLVKYDFLFTEIIKDGNIKENRICLEKNIN